MREGVEEKAKSFGMYAAYRTDNIIEIGMGLSFISFDDKEGFSQAVEGVGLFNDGDVSTESSSADGGMIYLDIGPQFDVLDDKVSLSTKLGASYINASRSISNCSDCASEDIDIESGAYFLANAGYNFSWGTVGLGYTSYFSDEGLSDTLKLMFRYGIR